MKKLAIGLIISALCVVSILMIPEVGAYGYAIIGFCTGVVATVVLSILAIRERAPWWVAMIVSIIGGFVVGIFWPAAIVVGFFWLSLSDPGDRASSPLSPVQASEPSGPRIEDAQQREHADQS